MINDFYKHSWVSAAWLCPLSPGMKSTCEWMSLKRQALHLPNYLFTLPVGQVCQVRYMKIEEQSWGNLIHACFKIISSGKGSLIFFKRRINHKKQNVSYFKPSQGFHEIVSTSQIRSWRRKWNVGVLTPRLASSHFWEVSFRFISDSFHCTLNTCTYSRMLVSYRNCKIK